MLLDVPIFAQEHSWTCLPACIRMVLAYRGALLSENEITDVCGTVPWRGTPPEKALEGIEKLGFRALWFENADLQRLVDLTDEKWPVIVFLRSSDLPYGKYGLHAAVVVGFKDGQVVMADPVLGALTQLATSHFARAWTALGAQGMVIWQQTST